MDRIEVFGLDHLSGKIPELLKKKVVNKKNPDKWTWKPAKAEKIKHLLKELKYEKAQVNYAAISNYEKIEGLKQKIVLVFWMGNLSYSLIENLKKENIKFVFVDFVQFIFKGSVTIVLDNETTIKTLEIDDICLNLDDVSAVLWNPPRHPSPFIDFDMIPEIKGRHKYLFKKRWAQLLKDLAYLIPSAATWIPGNPFNGSQEWQNKIGEYLLAKEIGFKIPPTILTNNKISLDSYVKNYGNALILREFCAPPYSFPPIHLDLSKISFKNFSSSPVCFQQYIDKDYELRVVVLFDSIYPCKIYSQDSKLTEKDWRVHDDANVKWELIKLPIEVNRKLIKIKDALKLNWCSVDLIVDKKGEYYYLETNRPGAHYWLDLFVGLDISKEIVKHLKKIVT